MKRNAVPGPCQTPFVGARHRTRRSLGGTARAACFVIAAIAGIFSPYSIAHSQLLRHHVASPIGEGKERLDAPTPALSRTASESARISRATPQEPAFAKTSPFILVGAIAALLLAAFAVSKRARFARMKRANQTGGQLPSGVVEEETARKEPREPRLDQASPNGAPADDDLVFALAPGEPMIVAKPRTLTRLRERFRRPRRSSALERTKQVHDGNDAGLRKTRGTVRSVRNPLRDALLAADLQPLTERIVAVHVPGRGLHIVVAGIPAENAQILIDLARALADKGRSIIVDLDRTPARLAPLASADEASDIDGLLGLSELLIGDASYAEVIHRDRGSRLHFIPTGRLEADFRDFDLILDALTMTYDFIIMLAPAYPQSEIAKIMAPFADFVVLTPAAGADGMFVAEAERELTEAGAHEVLIIGHDPRPLRQQVA